MTTTKRPTPRRRKGRTKVDLLPPRQIFVTLQRQPFGQRIEYVTGYHNSEYTPEYRLCMSVVGARSVKATIVAGWANDRRGQSVPPPTPRKGKK